MSKTSKHIKSFFEKGRVICTDRQLFRSVLEVLNKEHAMFVEECQRENILRIDHRNLIIELIVL